MIYAIRNNKELEGVYTNDSFNPEWLNMKGLSVKKFKDKDKAEEWVHDKKALEKTQKRKLKASKKKKSQSSAQKNTKKISKPIKDKSKRVKPAEAIKKIKELLEDKNIVSGYGEDCCHKEFVLEVNSFLCPWDGRVQNGYSGSVNFGCYYECNKKDNKILENKEIYLNAIDKLLLELEKNPNLDKNFNLKNGILSSQDKKILSQWEKDYEKKEKLRYKEMNKYEKENKISFIGCPKELISDLKYISDNNGFDKNAFCDFTFKDDEIILKYIDWNFTEETTSIDSQTIWFSIMPSMDKPSYIIELGTGCNYIIENQIHFQNEKLLEDFYLKWKDYRRKNPDKYIEYVPTDNELSDLENTAKYISEVECAICIFADHCDGVFCLKG